METTPKRKRPALGMGLDALLPDRLEGEFFLCPIDEISPSPQQPRHQFDDTTIAELAQSIREKGLIQPVILRRGAERAYELIAGERRWRAAQLAGVTEIPAILREADEEEVLEMALIENLQREDLNPVDEARAYLSLVQNTGMTQGQVAERVGKSRVAVANALRLLALSDPMLDALRDERITAGHARALLTVEEAGRREAVFREILRRGLSVRQAEALARGAEKPGGGSRTKDPNLVDLEARLSRSFGTRVTVQPGRARNSGRISVEFRNLDELDRILDVVEGRDS